MSSNSYFVIVGTRDNPLYEADLGQPPPQPQQARAVDGGGKKDEHKHLNQFIVHAALDVVEDLMWGTNAMYLKVVDKFNEWYISAYVTASGAKLMLLHDTANTDGIRNFFQDTHELYIKAMLNPFTEINSPIKSAHFDTKVRALARKWL
ncbi:Sedlin [Geranomyces variabilis]|nr:Sedlin [Geranomyces variabilis]KAJ3142381.1 Trafficking protein particle complex subunit 2 [Geranomyces variabilis]